MGFLAPLYALAALAVAAPILFHLIRRRPKGEAEFSSLMFLTASPPRLTRRSRLDNIWLLLLRAAALLLIAFAFARPFMRSASMSEPESASRRVLIVLDNSGSMQRDGVWDEAQRTARELIQGLGKQDRVALAAGSSEFQVIVPFDEKAEGGIADQTASHASVLSALNDVKPTWHKSNLADQLIAAAELVQQRGSTSSADATAGAGEIILISDLHESVGLDGLQGFSWPENVRLDVRIAKSKRSGNARPTLMTSRAALQPDASDGASGAVTASNDGSSTADRDEERLRIRVFNSRSSRETGFELKWAKGGIPLSNSQTAGSAIGTSLQVPPGQTRVALMPPRPATADSVVLLGDAEPFDNVVYVPEQRIRKERLLYVGSRPQQSEEDLFYYLKNVPFSSKIREIALEQVEPAVVRTAVADPSVCGVIIEAPFADELTDSLKEICSSGRPVLVCLSRKQATESTAGLEKLLHVEGLQITDADVKDYALLGDIRFSHPLFQPFADVKFNDFGKIRFWSHRSLKWNRQLESTRTDDGRLAEGLLTVPAKFEDGNPAFLHRQIGQGDLWVTTAGWQVTAGQMALSSKFVPLLFGMLDPHGRSRREMESYPIGVPITLVDGAELINTESLEASGAIEKRTDKWRLEIPGLFRIRESNFETQVAAEIPEDESMLEPLDVERFGQLGVLVGKSETAAELNQKARQLQTVELESRQKIWQWLLLAALVLIAAETFLAGRLAGK
ncbi:MAG: BatA domain-containing protein [Pirellulales bacterium]